MSASGRSVVAQTGHVRHADDFYATPAWCTRSVLETLDLKDGLRVLEPAAGEGAILRELLGANPRMKVQGVEVDEGRMTRASSLCRVDHSSFIGWKSRTKFDLVITNPPFALAMDFIQASLPLLATTGTAALLLRLNWLASMKRASFLTRFCPDVFVLPRRPSFTGGGTDATDYGWFLWRGPEPRPSGQVRVLPVNVQAQT
jgi:hypothetical protein